MDNVFSLTEVRLLSEDAEVLSGNGYFLLYQTQGDTEMLRSGEQRTLSIDEVFIGNLQNGYTLHGSDLGKNRAVLILAQGELTENLSELYGIKDGFSAKVPEARELFEEILKSFNLQWFSETEKLLCLSLSYHKLLHLLHRSPGTRFVRRHALRIKDYIDAHFEEKLDLDTLAGVFFMSKTQLHRLFKDEYGIPPIRYLTKCKIELSKKLLENESLKLSEIADALSFSDAKHFSKTFFKHEGILPGQYRKNIKNNSGDKK